VRMLGGAVLGVELLLLAILTEDHERSSDNVFRRRGLGAVSHDS